ncbi:MAG TPA: recombinase [Roseburia sp.]|nr:recombinase [Roseburia sp.]
MILEKIEKSWQCSASRKDNGEIMGNTDKKEIYKTAMYLRLSKGDGDVDGIDKAESNSITNQRMIILSFLEKHQDLKLVDIYIDDGYTGTNFNRPELKRMMADIDAGKIDAIVCKDLSRFGRERIETGNYIAKIFKQKGVRFIAINDNYDTLTAEGSETNIVMPVKALTNDNFSRDISTKVRSSQSIKREIGDYIGAFAPYGYMKSEKNKNRLVPDPGAAGVVQEMFAKKLAGVSANCIAKELNARGVLSPAEYKKQQGQNFKTNFQGAKQSQWSAKTVIRILQDEVYIGTVVQGKRSKVSYKVKKEINRPQSEWIRVENMHEAIVRKCDFDAVQILMSRDSIKSSENSESYMYSALLYCGDCGKSMVRRKSFYSGREHICYICSDYNRYGNCSRHTIREEDLNEIVLGELKRMIDNMCDYQKLAENLDKLNVNFDKAVAHDREIAHLKSELEKCSTLKSALYQDLKEGIISQIQFNQYRENYTNREMSIQSAIKEQENIIRGIYENGIAAGTRLDELREKLTINSLDRIVLVTFIDRILIFDDNRIEIVFKYRNEMEKMEGIICTANQKEVVKEAV